MDRNHSDGDTSIQGLPTAPLGTCLQAAIFTPPHCAPAPGSPSNLQLSPPKPLCREVLWLHHSNLFLCTDFIRELDSRDSGTMS